MNRAQWEYRPQGSGPGHLQRVGGPGEYATYTASQAAYRAYQDHVLNCVTCGEIECARADELWQVHVQARGGGDQS